MGARRQLGLALALALCAAGAAAEPVPIPGTRVRLEVPEGFRLSPDFPGLGRESDLTSVLVTELAMPLESARDGFSAEALASRGLALHQSDEVAVGPHQGTLLHATQRAGGTTFRKWLLLVGDARGSVLITATTPLDLEATHQEALVGALRSARWEPSRPLESGGGLREGLRFRVDEVPPFEVVTTAPNAVVLADASRASGSQRVPASIAVGASLGRVHIANLAAFARGRLGETATLDEVEVREERPSKLGALVAHELTAEARDIESGRPVRVTQRLASDGERYYLLQGIFDAEDGTRFDAALAAVAESFTPLDPAEAH